MKHYSLNQKNLIINEITSKGFCVINDVFNKNEIKKYTTNIKNIYKKRLKLGESVGSTNNQCIYNFFYEDLNLMPLVYIKKIDKILEKLLDENYVLQSSNAQNRQIEKIDRNKKNFKIGNNWHTDSRYVNNKRISNGFSYLVIVALEDFTRNTASTQFIKDSFKNFTKPKRFTQKKYNTLKMKSGSVCIMDTGITHRGGVSTKTSRWSIFNIYSPWFVKPYYQFNQIIKKKKLSRRTQKLLHFYSTPPENQNIKITTLIKF